LFFSRRRRHTRFSRDWSSDVCSSDLGELWQDKLGLVFTSEIGTPLDPSNVRRALYGLMQKAGLPKVTVHGLRHTFASLALEEGRSEERRVGKERGPPGATRHNEEYRC